MKTTYSMNRLSGYGQYCIIKTTASGKIERKRTTDSMSWDKYTEGKLSQAAMKRMFS